MNLLVEAPAGRHFAQIHREIEALVESMTVFLEAGVRRGNSVLVVADVERVAQLHDRLAASKLQPTALRKSGQLTVMEAPVFLAQFGAGPAGATDWAALRELLAPTLARMRPSGRDLRIYTEIASTLWNAGNTVAAIQLEELWNSLAASYEFSLYCGYCMDTHAEQSYAAPLEELGRTHSDMLGTPEDERFGAALDRASKEIFGITLTEVAGVSRPDGARRLPSGQRTMLWVKRNLPMSTTQIVERARHYFRDGRA